MTGSVTNAFSGIALTPYVNAPTFQITGVFTSTFATNQKGYQDAPVYTTNDASATLTGPALYSAFISQPTVNETAGTLNYSGERRAVDVRDFTVTGTPVFTSSTHVGVSIEDLTQAATNLSLRSEGAAVEMRHAGPAVFGANAAPTNASVGLEVQSTTQAFLAPRMTTAQRNALTALNGMIIYNTTTNQMEGYINSAWAAM
jgi:hypothetical protein